MIAHRVLSERAGTAARGRSPEPPVTLAGVQRLQAVFGVEAIVFVRFHNTAVNKAIFHRNAVDDSLSFTYAPRGRRHRAPQLSSSSSFGMPASDVAKTWKCQRTSI